jgi:tellurite methyltransferase
MNRSVRFFDEQFQRQARTADYALNPFENAVLPHLSGEVLDLGCGLGNLSIAAAAAGCRVTAVDASPAGVADLQKRAAERQLRVDARVADVRTFVPAVHYDCVVAIGLLMFLPCSDARALLARLRDAVRPAGLAAINVLVEGTTYLDMFDPAGYCLFGRFELIESFPRWPVMLSKHEDFRAPGGTLKSFHTLVVRR